MVRPPEAEPVSAARTLVAIASETSGPPWIERSQSRTRAKAGRAATTAPKPTRLATLNGGQDRSICAGIHTCPQRGQATVIDRDQGHACCNERTGEGYGKYDPLQTAADDLLVRERATTASAFDPAEIHRGRHADTPPSVGAALLPLIVVILVNLVMSLVVLPRLDTSFLAEERWGATSLSAVGGVWAVVVA